MVELLFDMRSYFCGSTSREVSPENKTPELLEEFARQRASGLTLFNTELMYEEAEYVHPALKITTPFNHYALLTPKLNLPQLWRARGARFLHLLHEVKILIPYFAEDATKALERREKALQPPTLSDLWLTEEHLLADSGGEKVQEFAQAILEEDKRMKANLYLNNISDSARDAPVTLAAFAADANSKRRRNKKLSFASSCNSSDMEISEDHHVSMQEQKPHQPPSASRSRPSTPHQTGFLAQRREQNASQETSSLSSSSESGMAKAMQTESFSIMQVHENQGDWVQTTDDVVGWPHPGYVKSVNLSSILDHASTNTSGAAAGVFPAASNKSTRSTTAASGCSMEEIEAMKDAVRQLESARQQSKRFLDQNTAGPTVSFQGSASTSPVIPAEASTGNEVFIFSKNNATGWRCFRAQGQGCLPKSDPFALGENHITRRCDEVDENAAAPPLVVIDTQKFDSFKGCRPNTTSSALKKNKDHAVTSEILSQERQRLDDKNPLKHAYMNTNFSKMAMASSFKQESEPGASSRGREGSSSASSSSASSQHLGRVARDWYDQHRDRHSRRYENDLQRDGAHLESEERKMILEQARREGFALVQSMHQHDIRAEDRDARGKLRSSVEVILNLVVNKESRDCFSFKPLSRQLTVQQFIAAVQPQGMRIQLPPSKAARESSRLQAMMEGIDENKDEGALAALDDHSFAFHQSQNLHREWTASTTASAATGEERVATLYWVRDRRKSIRHTDFLSGRETLDQLWRWNGGKHGGSDAVHFRLEFVHSSSASSIPQLNPKATSFTPGQGFVNSGNAFMQPQHHAASSSTYDGFHVGDANQRQCWSTPTVLGVGGNDFSADVDSMKRVEAIKSDFARAASREWNANATEFVPGSATPGSFVINPPLSQHSAGAALHVATGAQLPQHHYQQQAITQPMVVTTYDHRAGRFVPLTITVPDFQEQQNLQHSESDQFWTNIQEYFGDVDTLFHCSGHQAQVYEPDKAHAQEDAGDGVAANIVMEEHQHCFGFCSSAGAAGAGEHDGGQLWGETSQTNAREQAEAPQASPSTFVFGGGLPLHRFGPAAPGNADEDEFFVNCCCEDTTANYAGTSLFGSTVEPGGGLLQQQQEGHSYWSFPREHHEPVHSEVDEPAEQVAQAASRSRPRCVGENCAMEKADGGDDFLDVNRMPRTRTPSPLPSGSQVASPYLGVTARSPFLQSVPMPHGPDSEFSLPALDLHGTASPGSWVLDSAESSWSASHARSTTPPIGDVVLPSFPENGQDSGAASRPDLQAMDSHGLATTETDEPFDVTLFNVTTEPSYFLRSASVP
ncbi:unnamed protein product [Amoebophrya sp. A120]|nr:unnamed protein product [Amoebophrya sp. A120]|eukprot:GSA120T00004376001.1